jgi:hypothetical protein
MTVEPDPPPLAALPGAAALLPLPPLAQAATSTATPTAPPTAVASFAGPDIRLMEYCISSSPV